MSESIVDMFVNVGEHEPHTKQEAYDKMVAEIPSEHMETFKEFEESFMTMIKTLRDASDFDNPENPAAKAVLEEVQRSNEQQKIEMAETIRNAFGMSKEEMDAHVKEFS